MGDINEADRCDTNILFSSRDTCSSCGYKRSYYRKKREPNLIPTEALKLEEMASVSVAIGLWNHITSSSPDSLSDVSFRLSLCHSASELIDKLPLPESFREDIDQYFSKLNCHVDNWGWYHYRALKTDYDRLYRYVDRIVWHPNGAVNYYKTALNLLKLEELSDLEKYRLACRYCLKEEIEKRRPHLVEIGAPVKAEFSNNADDLFCYWNFYCAGKLHLFPVSEDLFIDEFMFLEDSVNNWRAIEFFFDRIAIERRVACAIRFIDGEKYEYQELLLLKLNESQRTQVYAIKAVRILQNYLSMSQLRGIEREVNEHNAISTWYEVRDLITWPQFVGLMNRLLMDSPPVSNDILMEIWASSYDELKLPLLNHADYDFIGDVFQWACEIDDLYRYDHSIREECDFFFAALEEGAKVACKPVAEWDEDLREKYFNRLCCRMMEKGEVEWLTRVINLCSSNAQDNAKIKRILRQKKLRNSTKTVISTGCEKLISTYEFAKLVQFLNFFYPDHDDPESRKEVRGLLLKNLTFVDSNCLNFYMDGEVSKLNEWLAPLISSYPEIMLEYKKYLLCSDRGLRACYSHLHSTTNVLAEILADGLSLLDDLIELGRKIIFSEEGICKLHENGDIEWLARVVNSCVPDSQDCTDVKHKLRIMCQGYDDNDSLINIVCKKLIAVYEFSKLVHFLNFFYSDDDPKSRYEVRYALLENLKYYADRYCLNFYIDGEVSKLNEWLAPLISSYPEIILEYKKYLLFSERGLRACCSHFDSLTNVMAEVLADSLPRINDLIELGRQIIFSKEGICKLHKIGEVEWLARVANSCVPDAQDCTNAKQKLKKICRSIDNKTIISIGCKKLISVYEFSSLAQFLNFFYPDDDPESRQEVRDVLLENLKHVDSYCLNFYMDGEVSELNELLTPLISSYPEIILEYKKYLLFSKRGLRACYLHFDSTINVLDAIVSDGLPEKDDLIEFGRKIIFSNEGICKLHKLLHDKSVPNDVVKRNIDLFLKSNRSKQKLKEELIRSLGKKESLSNKKYIRFLTSFFDF